MHVDTINTWYLSGFGVCMWTLSVPDVYQELGHGCGYYLYLAVYKQLGYSCGYSLYLIFSRNWGMHVVIIYN